MAYRSSSALAGVSAATAAVPVPTGAAINDIVVVGLYVESAATITPPAGFTAKAPDLATSPTARGRIAVFWNRLTAADTGTYTFTWTGAAWRVGVAAAFSGRVTTGDPFDATPGSIEGTVAATTSVNPGTTPITAFCDLVGIATSFTGGTWTPPAGLTERQDNGDLTIDTADAVAAGATGTKTFTCTGSGFTKSWLGALTPAGTTPTPSPVRPRAMSWVPLIRASTF